MYWEGLISKLYILLSEKKHMVLKFVQATYVVTHVDIRVHIAMD